MSEPDFGAEGCSRNRQPAATRPIKRSISPRFSLFPPKGYSGDPDL